MYTLKNLWEASPARIIAFVSALIVLLAAYGLNISDDQGGKIIAALSAFLILTGGEAVRSKVYSPKSAKRAGLR